MTLHQQKNHVHRRGTIALPGTIPMRKGPGVSGVTARKTTMRCTGWASWAAVQF